MNVCICGGGSLGHVCIGVLSSHKDVSVNLYTGHVDRWGESLEVKDINGKVYSGVLNVVSSDPEVALRGCDMVLLCLPGFLIEKTLKEIEPYVEGKIVGSIVSSTGFFFCAHRVLGDRSKLFGFQRVPFIARVAEYGHSANLLGYKPKVSVAVENVDDREWFRKTIESLFLTETALLDSFYEAALTNSNPILHTGRLFSMFCGSESKVFDHNILFYKEWTDDASQLLIDMDKEFFLLLEHLDINHGKIQPLLEYYESTDASSLTRKITSIPAFQNIESPMKRCGDGWVADFGSRYFTEDFPYGLRFIKELSVEHDLHTPFIDSVYQWGMDCVTRYSTPWGNF